MTVLDSLSDKENNAIEELQMRIKNCVTPKMREDDFLYYRFLKARDFDVDKAEKMLRKHITWRKVNQIDTILEDFQPSEFFLRYPEPSLLGYDKEGNMIRYSPTGTFNPTEVNKSVTMSDFLRHWMWFGENSLRLLKEENERTGRNAYQGIIIFNLEKVTFSAVTSSYSAEIFLRFINMYQDNYPERMRYAFVINAPSFFVMIFSLLRKVMSSAMIKKIHIFGSNGWKEKLLELIDADVLPGFLGGNRTDPDGDPLCRTSVIHDGKIPKYFFLSNEDRFFKDKTEVKKIIVPSTKKEEIQVEVNDLGSLLRWEFFVKSKDIGFGLFLEASEHKVTEVIPIQKYETSDGAERGSHKCRSIGKFTIVFDNSYSWLSAKEVHYRITLIEPPV